MSDEAAAAAEQAGSEVPVMVSAPLSPGEGRSAGTSGQKPIGKKALAKSKHHGSSKKTSKVSELDVARRSKAIDREIAKALRRADSMQTISSDRDDSSRLFAEQPSQLQDGFDTGCLAMVTRWRQ